MQTARTIAGVRVAVHHARAAGATVGFVPTMGYLHRGHLSLIDVARDAGATFVVVSVFVNPRQFAPSEDLSRYPRDEVRDLEALEAADVDLVFLPEVDVMYPPGATTTVSVGGVSAPLEGERRPGHFDGVATVVVKLFGIVGADIAAFGRKDAQQCAVIEQLVCDLDIPVRLVFGETVREPDGLAMSSRNGYLTAQERAKAPVLHRALRAGEEAIRSGVREVAEIENAMRGVVAGVEGVEVDYLAVIDPATFLPPSGFEGEILLAGAVRIGKTRLIDNVRL